jgi:hypothetical protein
MFLFDDLFNKQDQKWFSNWIRHSILVSYVLHSAYEYCMCKILVIHTQRQDTFKFFEKWLKQPYKSYSVFSLG